MSQIEEAKNMLDESENGIITTAQIEKAGFSRKVLRDLVDEGEVYRFGRGLYMQSNTLEDDFYMLQCKYGRGIYSHDTALYLLGYADRTPTKYTMTFPKGYNAPSLKQENVSIKRAVMENYSLGIIKIKSPSGNIISVYELERTLCDILRGNGSDIDIIVKAMKRYASSSHKDMHKLISYAEQLHVKPKILRYMEVLL